jgi:hypothetical protein
VSLPLRCCSCCGSRTAGAGGTCGGGTGSGSGGYGLWLVALLMKLGLVMVSEAPGGRRAEQRRGRPRLARSQRDGHGALAPAGLAQRRRELMILVG